MQTGLINEREQTNQGRDSVQREGESNVTEASAYGYSAASAAEPVRARRQLPLWLRAGTPWWIWVGVAVIALGFVLIAVAWGQVAAETQVHLQLPYVVSAGLVGLGVVMVGLTILNVVTRQRDGIDRDNQIDRLIAIIEGLRQSLAEQPDRRP